MTRPMRCGMLVAGAAWLVWVALVRRTGDSRMVWQSDQLDELQRTGDVISGAVTIANEGNTLGVVRRVDGRIVEGGAGTVMATLRGSRPPERGWWVSNILLPGASCVAEVDVHLHDGAPMGPLVIELTAQEMGRRLFQYRTSRFAVPL